MTTASLEYSTGARDCPPSTKSPSSMKNRICEQPNAADVMRANIMSSDSGPKYHQMSNGANTCLGFAGSLTTVIAACDEDVDVLVVVVAVEEDVEEEDMMAFR